MRTLVTGGAGFLGLHLLRSLLSDADRGDEFVVVDHLGRHGRDAELEALLADPRVRFAPIDLAAPGAVTGIPGRFERIYHLAAIVGVGATMTRPADVLRTNVLSEIALFDWAAAGGLVPGGRLLFASTSETYAGTLATRPGFPVPTPEDVPLSVADPADPRSAYAVSKLVGECHLLARFAGCGRDAVVARYHNVYGPRMGRSHVIPEVMERILSGESPLRRFGSEQTRAFCEVRDAVRATRLLMETPGIPGGTIVHVGDDRSEISIGGLYDLILAAAGAKVDFLDLPAPRSSPARRCPDISRLRELTGYEPEVSLADGLAGTWRWYERHHRSAPAAASRPVAAGGAARPKRIPLATPVLGEAEAEAVADCVRSGWVSSAGPEVDKLPRRVLDAIGATGVEGCALYSGTAAIELALRLSGVRAGDVVLAPELTFAGTVNPILSLGAEPVLLDVEAERFGLDPEALSDFLETECVRGPGGVHRRRDGRRVAAVIPVHLLGRPCRIEEIAAIARRHGLAVIEDAAEALGSTSGGRPCGLFGDIGVFSFNGNKIVTGGSGGLLVSADPGVVRSARHLATQARVGLPEDPAEWVHDRPGFNLRMTNLTAALLVAQIGRLPRHVERKREIALRYAEGLAGIPGLEVVADPDGVASNHWLSALLVDATGFGMTRRELARGLEAAGVETRPIFAPLGEQPAFRAAERRGGDVSRSIWNRALCLPSSPDLGPADQERVLEAILAFAPAAAR